MRGIRDGRRHFKVCSLQSTLTEISKVILPSDNTKDLLPEIAGAFERIFRAPPAIDAAKKDETKKDETQKDAGKKDKAKKDKSKTE